MQMGGIVVAFNARGSQNEEEKQKGGKNAAWQANKRTICLLGSELK